MGGIKVDGVSRTTMKRLYAAGETACNGVHGRNRLASNSLLESLVFARRAALDITATYSPAPAAPERVIDPALYENWEEEYSDAVLAAIEKEKKCHE